MTDGPAASGRPSSVADRQGPAPSVVWARSAVPTLSLLQPSGTRRVSLVRLIPAPSTASTSTHAWHMRDGLGSPPGDDAASCRTAPRYRSLSSTFVLLPSPLLLKQHHPR